MARLFWPRRRSAVVRSARALSGVLLLPGFFWARVRGGFVPCPSAVVCAPVAPAVPAAAPAPALPVAPFGFSAPAPAGSFSSRPFPGSVPPAGVPVSVSSGGVVRRVFPLGGSAPSGAEAAALSSWVASCSGSVLLLSSPAFVSLVGEGRCPVSLAFSAFRRVGGLSRWGGEGWPVRSACVGALSLAGRAGAFSLLSSGLLRSFLASAVPSLGLRLGCPLCSALSASSALSALWPRLSALWSGVVLPSPPSWASSARFSLSGLSAGFSSLSGALSWLVGRGELCAPAVRPFLACLSARALLFLSSRG